MRLKKVIAAALVCCSLCIPVGISNAYYFSGYQEYLFNNKNYECAMGHGGSAQYVDKSSVVCLNYNPPFYRLAANIITYNSYKQSKITKIRTMYFDYYYNTHQIYGYYDNLNGIKFGPCRYNSTSTNDIYLLNAAKIIWKTAYNINW